ncbi:RHS repeat-associated core domain-containing protein [Pseudomonas wadenswilerensis]
MSSSRKLHQHTPRLAVSDARGARVRDVAYCRALVGMQAETRVTGHAFDLRGHDVAARDPRAWGTDRPANRTALHSLSGRTLLNDSQDAGWRLALFGEAGVVREAWDSRGAVFLTEYDAQLRPVARHEQAAGEAPRVIERLHYAGAGFAAHNQSGRLLRHDDPAGSVLFDDYALGGQLRMQRRRFLDVVQDPDWPLDMAARDALLEAGEGYASAAHFTPTGDPCLRIDALGNRQWLLLDQAGALRRSTVQLADEGQPRTVRDLIRYDAMGRVTSETAGNDVVTARDFCPRDGRLQRQLSWLPGQAAQQDLHYGYDPAGNILSIEDLSQAIRFHRNQRVAALQTMSYDTLYQLVEAHGVEVDQPSHGPGLPPLYDLPLDPTRLVNYQQRFTYDAAGNLLQRQHGNAAGLRMAVATTSNRALPQRADGGLPDDAQIAEAHDGCGNLLHLDGLAALHWNPRNQLAEVRQVLRESASDDYERYVYAADGNRVRKLRVAQARSRSLSTEVRYLPGLELHREVSGETRQVVLVDEHLRIADAQWCYSLGDHLGSIAVELDEEGALLSREAFYPFGGTAVWAARSVVQGNRKTHRYCGKERDASGLYCFGLRYYAPWLARWTSADPLGEVDGLNLYRMVSNNPVSHRDVVGGFAIPAIPHWDIPRQAHSFWAGEAMPAAVLQNALMFQYHNPDWQVNLWTPKPMHWVPAMLEMESEGTAVQRFLAREVGGQIVHRYPEEMFTALAGIYPQAHKVEGIFAREGAGSYPNWASMSDAFRLGVLHAYGGLWLDGDVAVADSVELAGLYGEFFMLTDGNTSSAVNGVMAAERGGETGRRLLDQLVRSYSTQSSLHGLLPYASWTGKRSGAGSGPLSRLNLTKHLSGPDMIVNVLGKDRVNREAGALPVDSFYSRKSTPSVEPPYERPVEEVFYADYQRGLDASAGWKHVRPGRRSSIG